MLEVMKVYFEEIKILLEVIKICFKEIEILLEVMKVYFKVIPEVIIKRIKISLRKLKIVLR